MKFRQKLESEILSDAIKGAAIGGTIGGASVGLINNVLPGIPKFKHAGSGKGIKFRFNEAADILNERKPVKDSNSNSKLEYTHNANTRRLTGTGLGMIIGAALGAIVGGIRDGVSKYERSTSLSGQLENKIVSGLKSKGYSEGTDFTRNPKDADSLGTKVCFVISQSGDSLRMLINVKNDRKLGASIKQILSELDRKNIDVRNQVASDRFNEIKISSISGGDAKDTKFVVDMISKFINAGYPVYIVNVN